jgi:Family of unknown function (DUF6353)
MQQQLRVFSHTLTQLVSRKVLITQKHSPTILFAAGITGFVATTVLASRATLKLNDVLDTAEKDEVRTKELYDSGHPEYPIEEYQRDQMLIKARTAIDIVKLYTPAVAVGGASIFALTSSHHILNKRNAGLTAAYAALDKGFSEYRKRVQEELGNDKERELRYGSEPVEITHGDGKTKQVVKRVNPITGCSIYARFFDQLCNNWQKTPEYNLIFLKHQQNYANDRLRSRGHLFLNEVYDELGIERSREGAVVGWVLNGEGDDFVDFGIFDDTRQGAIDFVNGREGAILLDFNVQGLIYDKI